LKRKKSLGIVVVLIGMAAVFVGISMSSSMSNGAGTNSQTSTRMPLGELNATIDNYTGRVLAATINIEGTPETMYFPVDKALFNLNYTVDSQGNALTMSMALKPGLRDFYHQVGYDRPKSSTVVVYPVFTQAAYSKNGFYYFYYKQCDSSCLTVKLPDSITPIYQTGGRAFMALDLLNYSVITDADIDQNPEVLKNYDKVIVLHNEYVTQREFDAITSHPNVLYLFPNALFAKITTDYTNKTITLIRGHGYPDSTVQNGFGWKFDNSQYEYDVKCNNWQFYKIDNGTMVNCYPSFRMLYDQSFLQAIKDS